MIFAVAEKLGKMACEIAEMPITELMEWRTWIAMEIEAKKKASRAASSRPRRVTRRR